MTNTCYTGQDLTIVRTLMRMIKSKLILKLGLLTVAVVAMYVRTAEELGGAVGELHGEEARAEDKSLEESELESVLALPDVRSIEIWPHGIRSERCHYIHKLCKMQRSRDQVCPLGK